MHVYPNALTIVYVSITFRQLLRSNKQTMINKTLYSLTLITAFNTPMVLFTAIYGMNFDDMDELVGKLILLDSYLEQRQL
jgi:Mg2+ and Co2+ transporter CorA